MKLLLRLSFYFLAIVSILSGACSDDDGDDGEADDTDTTTITDAGSDTDIDSESESETDASTDSGIEGDAGVDSGEDSDTETGSETAGDCEDYPSGPYGWDPDSVLSPVRFPGMYGPDGEPEELDLCRVYANRDTIKSLIIGAGAAS